MESFHLAYIPTTDTLDDVSCRMSRSNEVGKGRAMAIRRASSLRLYRCHRHRAQGGESNGQEDDFCTADSSVNSAADNAEQRDENCPCCYRAESCSQDSLLPSRSFDVSLSAIDSEVFDDAPEIMNGNEKKPRNFRDANLLLAVLVPSCLTRSLCEVVDSQTIIQDKDSFDREIANQQIIDAELELRQSIHPCLCSNERRRIAHLDSVKSNEERERFDAQQSETIGENTPSSTTYTQMLVCGIITSNNVSNCTNFPADVVLLTPDNTLPTFTNNGRKKHIDRYRIISYFIDLLNHETASGAPWSVLKVFPVSSLSILPMNLGTTSENTMRNPEAKAFDVAALPCCPVCLNLIEPTHLGLPQLKPRHKCSQWCSGSNDHHDSNINSNQHSRCHACVNEMNVFPLPQCVACQVISGRGIAVESKSNVPNPFQTIESQLLMSSAAPWRASANRQDQNDQGGIAAPPDHSSSGRTFQSNSCYQCGMSTTLWVCLTCGVVGCGRYTRKHAAQHYSLEGHPYSFELATGRIWCYDKGTFVHRRDLVECPVLSLIWGIAVAGAEYQRSPLIDSSNFGGSQQRGESLAESDNNDEWRKERPGESNNRHRSHGLDNSIASCHNDLNHNRFDSKLEAPPKKSIMISQEYEALLHSALEDQSQHYEGEIFCLRATLASSRMQGIQISDRESREIHALQKDSERLKQDSETLSASLLEAQTKEAKLRSMSQRLLREQSISKELLEKIRKETLAEHESARWRMEDLEMQVADLTANLRMMSQLGEEERGGTICGTIGGEDGGKKRGKKSRKGKKKGFR